MTEGTVDVFHDCFDVASTKSTLSVAPPTVMANVQLVQPEPAIADTAPSGTTVGNVVKPMQQLVCQSVVLPIRSLISNL